MGGGGAGGVGGGGSMAPPFAANLFGIAYEKKMILVISKKLN